MRARHDTRPLIFLDIDGVVNTRESMKLWRERATPPGAKRRVLLPSEIERVFDKAACAELLRICRATNAVCVLSSTWRVSHSAREIERLIEDQTTEPGGVQVIGVTPRLDHARDARGNLITRGHEIEAWLAWTGYAGPFVVLDDDADMTEALLPRLVLTSMEGGLTRAHADRAIALLREGRALPDSRAPGYDPTRCPRDGKRS